MCRAPNILLLAAFFAFATSAVARSQSVSDPLSAQPPVDRQAMREATARWWIVSVSKLAGSLIERQIVGDRKPSKVAWSQLIYVTPQNGVDKTMMQIRYDCLKRTYSIMRRIDFDREGRTIADWHPEAKDREPAPSTFGEGALIYVCEPGTTLPGPFPVARDEEDAAKIAAALVALGEDADTAALLGSLHPDEDRAQIKYILTHTIKPANRVRAGALTGVPMRSSKRRH
jgi:hypothetical protein